MSKGTQQLFVDMADNKALANAMKNAKNTDDVLVIGRQFGYELNLEEVLKKIQESDMDEQQLGDISAAGFYTGDPSRYGIGSNEWNKYWNHYGGSYGGE